MSRQRIISRHIPESAILNMLVGALELLHLHSCEWASESHDAITRRVEVSFEVLNDIGDVGGYRRVLGLLASLNG